MSHIKLTYTVETSDHDGYCSGEECQYERKEFTCVLPTPKELSTYTSGEIVPLEVYEWNTENRFPERLLPDIRCYGSGYCNTSKEVDDNGLDKHDYRITITKMSIL